MAFYHLVAIPRGLGCLELSVAAMGFSQAYLLPNLLQQCSVWLRSCRQRQQSAKKWSWYWGPMVSPCTLRRASLLGSKKVALYSLSSLQQFLSQKNLEVRWLPCVTGLRYSSTIFWKPVRMWDWAGSLGGAQVSMSSSLTCWLMCSIAFWRLLCLRQVGKSMGSKGAKARIISLWVRLRSSLARILRLTAQNSSFENSTPCPWMKLSNELRLTTPLSCPSILLMTALNCMPYCLTNPSRNCQICRQQPISFSRSRATSLSLLFRNSSSACNRLVPRPELCIDGSWSGRPLVRQWANWSRLRVGFLLPASQIRYWHSRSFAAMRCTPRKLTRS